jgi:hypothetical protein
MKPERSEGEIAGAANLAVEAGWDRGSRNGATGAGLAGERDSEGSGL